MKACLLVVATAISAVIAAGSAWTGEKKTKDEATEKALSKIVQLGPGVHAIKRDKQGRITSCIIVGHSRISTVLGETKGLQDARNKARLDVSAQFVKWLKEKVILCEKNEEETILFLEGSEGNDQVALKESGKSVEKTGKKFVSVSQGLIRGLQVLHFEVSGKDKTYSLLMGWSAENAKATEKLEKGDNGKNKKSRLIKDQKATSDEAKKFLP
jgi:hypothetical protein